MQEFLEKSGDLEKSKPILVGVSGGPDSLTLLDILDRLGYPLVVAHLDHGLRPEAAMEAEHVRLIAQGRGLPFVVNQVDTADYARRKGLSLEEAARLLRYEFLFEQAQASGAQAVAVGHTADDQVETVLMHFLRGAGISGLKGMLPYALPNSWSERVALVRPLLCAWRREVLAYCAGRGLEYVTDLTNLDTTIYRNRLRHELIPYLEGYNPAVKQLLLRTAQVLAGDHQVLEKITGDAWDRCLASQGEGYVIFKGEAFNALPTGLRRRLVRRAIDALRPGLRDVDFDSVERALAFFTTPTQTGQRDLTAGLRLAVEGDELVIAAWDAALPVEDWPQVREGESRALPVPGELALNRGWKLTASRVEDVGEALAVASGNSDPYRAWIELDGADTLTVRARRDGDRFRPLGMGGRSLKLSEFMINVKLPRRARAGFPLVCVGEEIAWVPGFALAHPRRLRPDSREAAHVRMIRGG